MKSDQDANTPPEDQLHPGHIPPPAFGDLPDHIKPASRFPKLLSKKMALIAALTLLAAGGAAGAYFLAFKKDTAKTVTNIQTKQTADKSLNAVTDISWLSAPKKLADLKLFPSYSNINGMGGDNGPPDPNLTAEYYQVGSKKDGQDIIVAIYPIPLGPEGALGLVFGKDGQYKIIKSRSSDFYDDKGKLKDKPAPNVTEDSNTILPELDTQKTLDVKSKKAALEEVPYFSKSFYINSGLDLLPEGQTKTFVEKSVYGTLYKIVTQKDSVSELSYYSLVKPDFEVADYRVKSDLVFKRGSATSDKDGDTPVFTFNNGTVNDKFYVRAPSGCGVGNKNIIALNTEESDLVKVGQADKLTVYQPKNPNGPLQSTFYKEYKELTKDLDTSSPYGGLQVGLTQQQYYDHHALILAKDTLDQYQVFINGEVAVVGGCGKPVIYLYPEKSTKVSVKVGANIIKSLPAYGSGWTDVFAQPSGILTVAGKQYGSLFWEGFGHGSYPDVRGIGTLVARADLPNILPAQLTQLGLNQTERTEFMDFWLPKMPSTPYVKLTWLGTRQMDVLAPLTVTPKPDTTIRVFLDFEGLSSPVNLKPQRLGAVPRQGFTLVEWGGLLREGIR